MITTWRPPNVRPGITTVSFHELADHPMWGQESSQSLGEDVLGTRAQVLACLCVQDAWRRRCARRWFQHKEGSTVLENDFEGYEGYSVVEVEVVLSLLGHAGLAVDTAQTGGEGASSTITAIAVPPQRTALQATLESSPPGPMVVPPNPTVMPPAPAVMPPAPVAMPPSALAPAWPTESAEKEMVVKRQVEDVFAVVTDFEAYSKWVTGLKKVEVLERDPTSGLGRVVRFTAGTMGLSITYTLSYTMASPGLVSWISIEGGVKSIVGQYVLSAAEGASGSTRVQYRLDVELGFKIPGPVKRTVTNLVIGAALPDLKRYLEAGHGPKHGKTDPV